MSATKPRSEWVVSATSSDWSSLALRTNLDAFDPTALAPGHALLRHLSAIVCFTDIQLVEGIYFRSVRPPFTPGYSFIAVVEAISPPASGKYPEGCQEFNVGDIVSGLVTVGGWRTHSIHNLIDPKKNLVLVKHPIRGLPGRPADETINNGFPGNPIDLAQLTAVVLNIVTAYQLIHRSGVALHDGDYVLVHSAAGGVGSALCELLRAEKPGVKVLGTCSASKAEFARGLGCDPIDYRGEDFLAVVAARTEGRGVKAAYDAVGGANYARSYAALARDGRLVMYGSTGTASFTGNVPSIAGMLARNAAFWQARSATFFGVVLEREKNPAQFARDTERVFELLAEGKIDPHIDRIVGLADAKTALAFVKEGASRGSVVVEF
ncbi:hypothetical protein HK405_007895 [Cladochytrium tenue]|nr:hypothetical protein HK405_007895 [Cladochytrium tenue]